MDWSNDKAIKIAGAASSHIRSSYKLDETIARLEEAMPALAQAEESYQAAKAELEILDRQEARTKRDLDAALDMVEAEVVQAPTEGGKAPTVQQVKALATKAAQTDPGVLALRQALAELNQGRDEATRALAKTKAIVNARRAQIDGALALVRLAQARIAVFAGLDTNPPPASAALAMQPQAARPAQAA